MNTFYNNAICDIYIGKGAGKKLIKDISSAKKSIKIISPYLSPSLVKELIYLHTTGIDIKLITSDNIEDYNNYHDKNIHKLIIQHKKKDIESENIRNKWIDATKIIWYSIIGLSLTLILSIYFYRESKLLYGIIPLIILFLFKYFFQDKIKKKKIFNYSYTQLFPFKVFISPYKFKHYKNTYIHGKIYIIDELIVYMGSLNFTINGTEDNYETRIKTTDSEAVKKITKEFNELFYHSGLPEIEIQSWGKSLYNEPIN